MSMFETTANQALEDGWGDYDPDIATCDCGKLLDDDELLAGACVACQAAEVAAEWVPGTCALYLALDGLGYPHEADPGQGHGQP